MSSVLNDFLYLLDKYAADIDERKRAAAAKAQATEAGNVKVKDVHVSAVEVQN